MHNITILAVGKMKERYWREAGQEFLKRLAPYARVEVLEIPASAFRDDNKEKTRQEETEKIIKALSRYDKENVFLLDEGGKEMTSMEFSGFLASHENANPAFVIAGSLGFDKKIYETYKNRLSLSRMTFLHEAARVLLLEQIYRGIAINKGKSYHY